MPLQADQSFLLIVDVQRQLAPDTHDPQRTIMGCGRLIEAARILEVPTLMSEHYPQGLGPTVPELRGLVPDDAVIDKAHFSCAADEDFKARIDGLGRRQAVIAGM
ncbi:MAG: isochorismatase family protein, partial [Solimonas sp.]